jgi:hypothetical protein
MNSALLKLILIAALLLGGCAPLPLKSPTAVDRAETSAPASTLPAENTDTPIPEPTQTPLPKPDLPPLTVEAGLLDGVNVSSIDADTITRYWIEISVDFEDGSDEALIDGSAYIEYTNTTGQPLYDLVLRLWPNDPQYEARMEAGPVFRDGRRLDSELEVAGTVLRIPFSLPVADGDTISIHVPFSLEVGSFYGGSPRRLGITQNILIAPTFYPIIPRWLGEDWEVEQAPPGGDTTNSDTALYHLVINAPADFAIAASGIEVDRKALGDRQEMTFVSGPMRDFAFALGLFQENIRQVEGVSLRTWTLPEHEEDVDTLLESTTLQFELLSEMVGPYPYPELDIVDAPGAFGGIEYPGLVYIGTLGTPWIIEPTVHEVAHQWFYALIGDDQVDEPWLDEGAATFATALYYEHVQGSGRGAGYLSDLRTAVRNSANPELPIGLPVGEYGSENEYAVIVYFKGALFFETLRQRLGERDFEAFLKAYYDAYSFGFADAAGFQAVAETTCSCELDDLFDLWVYEGGEIPSLTE